MELAMLVPIIVFGLIMAGAWWVLSLISKRNSQAEDRLQKFGRAKSLAEIDIARQQSSAGMDSLKKTIEGLGATVSGGQSELEKNSLRSKLANAGFRSETAPAIYQGIRIASLASFTLPAILFCVLRYGFTLDSMVITTICAGIGFYLPHVLLGYLKSRRQKEIFLSLPDALDLLVVCVESGLGLDAGMRKVTDEMKGHAKTLSDEFSLANLQLQMGRPRREVLHDLGVRTGVDDLRSLAAILIQADRFGSSIAVALRVQSDSMRTKRRQLAEEKAAKTAVQLIFPLVLFIFPGIFVVLVGPAAIQISHGLFSTMK